MPESVPYDQKRKINCKRLKVLAPNMMRTLAYLTMYSQRNLLAVLYG
jgi:hypothetical protein